MEILRTLIYLLPKTNLGKGVRLTLAAIFAKVDSVIVRTPIIGIIVHRHILTVDFMLARDLIANANDLDLDVVMIIDDPFTDAIRCDGLGAFERFSSLRRLERYFEGVTVVVN